MSNKNTRLHACDYSMHESDIIDNYFFETLMKSINIKDQRFEVTLSGIVENFVDYDGKDKFDIDLFSVAAIKNDGTVKDITKYIYKGSLDELKTICIQNFIEEMKTIYGFKYEI